jgi:hypothetical protein
MTASSTRFAIQSSCAASGCRGQTSFGRRPHSRRPLASRSSTMTRSESRPWLRGGVRSGCGVDLRTRRIAVPPPRSLKRRTRRGTARPRGGRCWLGSLPSTTATCGVRSMRRLARMSCRRSSRAQARVQRAALGRRVVHRAASSLHCVGEMEASHRRLDARPPPRKPRPSHARSAKS